MSPSAPGLTIAMGLSFNLFVKFVGLFIYIDAGHTSLNVFADAILSWEILKPQGILAFDDYTWNDGISPEHCPKKGIDIFLKIKEGKYEILEKSYQVWVKKI